MGFAPIGPGLPLAEITATNGRNARPSDRDPENAETAETGKRGPEWMVGHSEKAGPQSQLPIFPINAVGLVKHFSWTEPVPPRYGSERQISATRFTTK